MLINHRSPSEVFIIIIIRMNLITHQFYEKNVLSQRSLSDFSVRQSRLRDVLMSPQHAVIYLATSWKTSESLSTLTFSLLQAQTKFLLVLLYSYLFVLDSKASAYLHWLSGLGVDKICLFPQSTGDSTQLLFCLFQLASQGLVPIQKVFKNSDKTRPHHFWHAISSFTLIFIIYL